MILERKLFNSSNICNKASVNLEKVSDFEKLKKDLNLSEEDILVHKNWATDGTSYYYCKVLENYNDFVGESLANYFNLKTAHYEVGKLNNRFVVASRNFNPDNINYLNAFDLINDNISHKSNLEKLMFLENKYGHNLVLDILKMTSLDIFMRQVDRIPANYIFENKSGLIRLGPLYDYSFAFFNESTYKYLNYILNLNFDSDYSKNEIYIIMKKYPEFYEYLINMSKIDLNIIIDDIIKTNNLNYNKTIDEEYKIENEISHKMLKKVL